MTETQDNHQMTKSDHRQAAVLVVVMTIILVSLSFFIFTWQKSREEVVTEKPTVDVPIKVSAVVGPQVRIKKQGGSYVLDPSTPITIGQNDSGINFLNETGETVGIFIPVLRNDNNKIINYPGTDQTTSFTLESLKADAAKCEADDEACRTYEFLGSVYPANFVGKIVFVPTTGPPTGPLTFKTISAGAWTTCGISTNDILKCWGDTIDQPSSLISSGIDIIDISLDSSNVYCAHKADETITCWGDGLYERVLDAPSHLKDATILPNVTKVTTGVNHACAIRSDNNVECWGAKIQGDPINSAIVNNMPSGEVLDITAGGYVDCAIIQGGKVHCWGPDQDNYGLLNIPAGLAANQVVAGRHHICALKTDGSVLCWGWNTANRLNVPEELRSPPSIITTSISTGRDTTCALKSDGAIACWGSNQELIDSIPQDIFAIDISVGYHHACALKQNGQAVCWGNNSMGQTDVPTQ